MKYILSYTIEERDDSIHSVNLIDKYEAFIDDDAKEQAEKRYSEVLLMSNLHSASLSIIVKSTDY